jgi:HEAT repeat protein
MTHCLSAALVGALLTAPASALDNAPAVKPESQELARIESRFKDDTISGILSAMSWTLAHCASEQEAAKLSFLFEEGGAPGGVRGAIERAGGVEAYRKKVATLLTSRDEVVRAFVAVWLGAFGDKRSVPDLLKLLRSTDLPAKHFPGMDRSRAAMALGLIGAKEHAREVAGLLKSESPGIRAGAALGLGYMKATEHADEVARLVGDKAQVRIAACAALAEMDARRQAKAIAAVLKAEWSGDPAVVPAALYALVRLRATEHAKDIAPLLRIKFLKGDAAKALALMDAREWKDEIAVLLDDADPLARSDGLLALGIMHAKGYEEKVARHLGDEESSVRPYAAWALVMMGSTKHAPRAYPLADSSRHVFSVEGRGVTQIATRDFRRVAERAEQALQTMRQELKERE